MKNTLIALFLLVCFTNTQNVEAQAEWDQFLYENDTAYCDSYPYFTLGVGPILILPNVGVGYRGRVFHHGFDISLSAATVIQAHHIQGIVAYQFYPNPYREDPWYVGLGTATSLYLDNHGHSGLTVAPDISVGKVTMTRSGEKHFWEAHVQAPTWGEYGRLDFPLMYIKYGVSFYPGFRVFTRLCPHLLLHFIDRSRFGCRLRHCQGIWL